MLVPAFFSTLPHLLHCRRERRRLLPFWEAIPSLPLACRQDVLRRCQEDSWVTNKPSLFHKRIDIYIYFILFFFASLKAVLESIGLCYFLFILFSRASHPFVRQPERKLNWIIIKMVFNKENFVEMDSETIPTRLNSFILVIFCTGQP